MALLFAGCFDAHGVGRDGGPAIDAPVTCELYPAVVQELRCPGVVVAGTPASVVVSTTPAACCGSGTVRTSGVSSGYEHRLALEWDACDCCEGCRCIGPIEDVPIDLGVLEPGTHRVLAGGQSCTFEVLPPAGACSPPDAATDFRAPRHLLSGQEYAVTLTSEPASSCSCSPRVTGAESLSYALELCECCDACDCIDRGYEASHVHDPLPIGAHFVGFPHGAGEVTVHAPDECSPIDVTNVAIVPPRRDLVHGGPALTWARVEGEQYLCCAEPVPVVERLDTTTGELVLRLSSCVSEDCECVPSAPTPTSAWFSLGELAPGDYALRAGEVTTTFTVE